MVWGTSSFKAINGEYHSDVKTLNSKGDGKYISKWVIKKSGESWVVTKFSNLKQKYVKVSLHDTLKLAKEAIESIERENVHISEEDAGFGQVSNEKVQELKNAGALKAAKVEKEIQKASQKTEKSKKAASETDMDPKFRAACKKASAEVMNRTSPSSRLVLLEAGGSGNDITYVLFQVGSKEYSARRSSVSDPWETEITLVKEG